VPDRRGAQTGSEKLREWATAELNGCYDAPDLPDYRWTYAPMELRITNRAGVNAITQPLHLAQVPRELFGKTDPEQVPWAQGIGELEAVVGRGDKEHGIGPSWGPVLVDYLNEGNSDEVSLVNAAYWVVQNHSIEGVLSQVRNPRSIDRRTSRLDSR
jgi:hypothetical protein